jgi:hypothetical protein
MERQLNYHQPSIRKSATDAAWQIWQATPRHRAATPPPSPILPLISNNTGYPAGVWASHSHACKTRQQHAPPQSEHQQQQAMPAALSRYYSMVSLCWWMVFWGLLLQQGVPQQGPAEPGGVPRYTHSALEVPQSVVPFCCCCYCCYHSCYGVHSWQPPVALLQASTAMLDGGCLAAAPWPEMSCLP